MRFHGQMIAPRTAVIKPPARNDILCGLRLTKALAGATTLAAILVDSVARIRPTNEAASGAAPDMRATTSKGSLTAAPKMETVAEVTASPMKEKAAITTGKPMACPVSWSRWLRAYLLKSGMLRASVAQYPTLAVSAGMNVAASWPALGMPAANCEGADSMGPSPPAAVTAQHSKAMLRAISTGAAYFSISRMDSTPSQTIATCSAQNARKHANSLALIPSHAIGSADTAAGRSFAISVCIELPPTQVWIPNQPQATRALSIEGMLAPSMPKLARLNTGKGIPYFVPGCAASTMGTRTSRFAIKMLRIPVP
mmetsp:Transcript_8458/g.21806  ORF Transcript_8458/g.21806 Transcript_8458/m.21806 type:complete len:311 (-) Transcript_8458:14-946(-)